nr:hypothetical protein RKHAN_02763 [Rhizobium sp. Khangiran2]
MRTFLLVASILYMFGTAHCNADPDLDLSGVPDPKLRQAIQNSSTSASPHFVSEYASEDQQREVLRLTQLMQAFGYLDAVITRHRGTNGLLLSPVSGHVYNLGYVAIEGPLPSHPAEFRAKIRLESERYVGQVARSDTVIDIGRKIVRVLEESGYPAPKIEKAELRKHPPAHLVGLHVSIDAGKQARFGDLIFSEAVAEDEFGPSDRFSRQNYHPAVIEALRQEIVRSGRYDRVSLSVEPRSDDTTIVDIHAKVKRISKSEEDLASHGWVGFRILAACCVMLAIRQTYVPALRGSRHRLSVAADAVIVLALLLGAAFATGRIIFMIS